MSGNLGGLLNQAEGFLNNQGGSNNNNNSNQGNDNQSQGNNSQGGFGGLGGKLEGAAADGQIDQVVDKAIDGQIPQGMDSTVNSAVNNELNGEVNKFLSDNDMYAHLNNSVYAFLIDSIVNTYLITHCGLNPFDNSSSSSSSTKSTSNHVGLVVSSYCDYFASVSFPAVLDLGLRVAKLGSTSVTYEIGVFKRGEESVKAVGGFTHVFVEKEGMKPAKGGMDARIRKGLEKLAVEDSRESKL
ncbi:thioesterase [Paecilomyces variotii No. 5]|uniref:Thioesterase n=1 Tax=Byssochlamys spectabilis (strain No. 5 / NBRC 109023) TaxID=1356009 RepID=V5F7A1_BYSSN|nr:thioesterase [Paecilomyces variotii No. 5]